MLVMVEMIRYLGNLLVVGSEKQRKNRHLKQCMLYIYTPNTFTHVPARTLC